MTGSITLSRTLLSLSPLVLSFVDDLNAIGVTNLQEPGYQTRVGYLPSVDLEHGEVPTGWSYQQALWNFDIVTDQALSEAESRSLLAEVRAAIVQSTFTLTYAVGETSGGLWTCHPGSMVPAGPRTMIDIRDHDPIWSVAIPCYPIPA